MENRELKTDTTRNFGFPPTDCGNDKMGASPSAPTKNILVVCVILFAGYFSLLTFSPGAIGSCYLCLSPWFSVSRACGPRVLCASGLRPSVVRYLVFCLRFLAHGFLGGPRTAPTKSVIIRGEKRFLVLGAQPCAPTFFVVLRVLCGYPLSFVLVLRGLRI